MRQRHQLLYSADRITSLAGTRLGARRNRKLPRNVYSITQARKGMIFTDQDGQPLEIGTAIDLLPYSADTGIVGYAPTGEQIIAHYSRLDRTLVLSPPEDFNRGNVPVRIAACVLSAKAGEDIWRDAIEEIETSCPEPLKDYDLIARVYERNVSNPRRDFSGLSFLGGFSSVGHLLPLPKFNLSMLFSSSSRTR